MFLFRACESAALAGNCAEPIWRTLACAMFFAMAGHSLILRIGETGGKAYEI